MELQPTDFTDRAATPPSGSICGICGSCKSVGSVCDCPIHSCRRWSCSPQISPIVLPPHLLCQSVKSVGAVGLWDPGATVESTDAADGTAAHRFHRSSCHPTLLCQSVESRGSCKSVGSVCDCPIHSWRRWNCSPQISQIELPPHLLCQSVESVGAVSLWDRCTTVPSTAGADGTAAHRFHRLSCYPTFWVNL